MALSAFTAWSAVETRKSRRAILIAIDALSLPRNFARWRLWDKGNAVNIFNALRVVCWAWVVAVTTVQQARVVPGFTSFKVQDPLYAFVYDPSLAIATFLYLSGYAAQDSLADDRHFGLVGINRPTLQGTVGAYCGIIARRWGRIMPLYLSVILLAHPVMSRFGSGPFWDSFVLNPAAGENCKTYWWTNVLFINNIVPTDSSQRCFPWAYYFALDFQFFALSPFITLLYYRAPAKLFYVVVACIAIASLVCIAAQDVESPLSDQTQPQLMLLPYLAGSLLCLVCREMDEEDTTAVVFNDPGLVATLGNYEGLAQPAKAPITLMIQRAMRVKRNRVIAIWFGWTLQVGTIVAQWAAGTFGSDRGTEASVRLLRLPFWILGLTGGVLPMLFGYGGWARRFLSHRLWVGGSRLVFAAYLFAPLISEYVSSTASSPLRDDFMQVLYHVWGNVWATLGIALVFHLVIERPVTALLGYDSTAQGPEPPSDHEADPSRRAPSIQQQQQQQRASANTV
jgi:peptidoglycan/LPS O-acetylase OafA/YrhL